MKTRALAAMLALGCSPAPETPDEEMSQDASSSPDVSPGDMTVSLPDLGPPPRALTCARDLEAAPMRASADLESFGLEVTERGVFWLRNQGGALVLGPPDGGFLTLMSAPASGATLTRRADGEVCAAYTREGVEAVAYVCTPDLEDQGTTIKVPVTGRLAAVEYTRLCHQSGCADGEGAYLWYQTMLRDVPTASRSTLWTARTHTEPQIARPDDALAAGGQPFGCVIAAGDRAVIVGVDEDTAAPGRVVAPDGATGIERCELATTDGALHALTWDGARATEWTLALLDGTDAQPASMRLVQEAAPLEVTSRAFDLGSGQGRAYAVFEKEGVLWRGERGSGEAWETSALPSWPGGSGVGEPKIALGPDGSLHVVTVLGEVPYYWRWCP